MLKNKNNTYEIIFEQINLVFCQSVWFKWVNRKKVLDIYLKSFLQSSECFFPLFSLKFNVSVIEW